MAELVLLVAGEGKRLLPLTRHIPKCLLSLGKLTILERTLLSFAAIGVKQVRLVVGYLADVIKNKIGNVFADMGIEYVHNDIYESTNSMYSLFLGLHGINNGVWVVEGDVVFSQEILSLSLNKSISWFVDSVKKDQDGSYIRVDDSGRAIALEILSDESTEREFFLKSVGILHLQPEGVNCIYKWLQAGVDANQLNVYYDCILARHLHEIWVETVDIRGKPWFEIDTVEDWQQAKEMFL
jgi:choline kinase